MTLALQNNLRGFETHQSSPKRVKVETTTLFHLDQALLVRIMNLLPSSMVFVMVQVNKRWRDVICLNRAQELGYQGVDLIHAKEHIQYLWKGILFFQQHDKRTGFGNLQLPSSNMNALPLFPRFPPHVDFKKRQFVYPHSHSLLLTACKNMHAHEICTWFLTNTHYYAGEQTPWIDFFEQESAWSAVPNSAAIPEPTLENEPELDSKEALAEKARIPLFHALSLACYFNRPRLIQILLNKGAHPDPLEKYKNPLLDPFKEGSNPLPLPLESMVAQRNVEGMKQLLDRGAKVTNQTLLAALGDSSDETNPLLENLYTRCNKPVDAVFLLRKALWNRSLALINLLQRDCVLAPDQAHMILKDFMDITFRREQSCTDSFAQALLKLLIEKGADVNGLYRTKYPPLHEVIRRKSLDWTRWFLEQKADVEINEGTARRTPLQTACEVLVDPTNPTPEECEMITLLLSYGAKPLLTGEDAANSPYHYAQVIGAHSIVALFDAHLNKA